MDIMNINEAEDSYILPAYDVIKNMNDIEPELIKEERVFDINACNPAENN